MEFLFCISAIRNKNIMKILLNNSDTDDLFYILERRTKKEKRSQEREVMRSEILSIP